MTPVPLKPLRVIIDTSVALPVLTREAPQDHWLVRLWKSRLIIPLINSETIRELSEKIREESPTAREFQTQRYMRKTLNHYSLWYETVPLTVVPDAPACREPDDQMFIELAIAGRADLLVARDDDFLRTAGRWTTGYRKRLRRRKLPAVYRQ